jgi:hypothetical protein
MKVNVSYAVTFELDVPKAEIEKALAEDDYLSRGGALHELAEKYKPVIAESLDLADAAEITGFYQSWLPVEGGRFILQDDGMDEAIWEA